MEERTVGVPYSELISLIECRIKLKVLAELYDKLPAYQFDEVFSGLYPIHKEEAEEEAKSE